MNLFNTIEEALEKAKRENENKINTFKPRSEASRASVKEDTKLQTKDDKDRMVK